MKKSKQLSLLRPQVKFFGGALLQNKRKSQRPLTAKDSIHFVLRSEWATGRYSFLVAKNRNTIGRILDRFAKKFGVKIYQRSINSNHVHLLLKITNRSLYKAFIKSISGQIASHVMEKQSFKLFQRSQQFSQRGDGPLTAKSINFKQQGFWQFRPFSRIVNWGQDFKICTRYIQQNVLEAIGFIPYKVRRNYYSKWLATISPQFSYDQEISPSFFFSPLKKLP
jgi:putative transposase